MRKGLPGSHGDVQADLRKVEGLRSRKARGIRATQNRRRKQCAMERGTRKACGQRDHAQGTATGCIRKGLKKMKGHEFDWYFGKNRTPTYRDPRDVAVQVVLSVAGTAVFAVGAVLMGGLWLGGII